MKIIYKIAVVAITILLFSLTGCKKDNAFESIETGQNEPIQLVHYGGATNRGTNNILFFDNLDTYKMTLEKLSQDTEAWDDAFVEQWGYLDDDALNAKEEELHFDDEKPLTDFENQYGFNSLRQKFNNEIETWLNNETLDEANDPNDKYFGDSVDMTLLGENGEIQVGESIYKFEKERIIEITDGDYNKLSLIIQGNTTILEDENVIVRNNIKDASICIDSSDSDSNYYYSGMYRIKAQWKLNNYHPFMRPYFKVKTISYKKRNGRWKRYRTTLESRLKGYLSFELASQACGAELHYQDRGRKKRRKRLSYYLKSPDRIFYGSYYSEGVQGLKSIHKQKFTVERWFGSN